MRGFAFILVLISIGCTTSSKDRIIVPELNSAFYPDALERIDDAIKSAPDDERLVDQKLFYCEQLEWPTTCISALDKYKEVNGMTNQLVEQYIAYYQQHAEYALLLEVIERWSEEYDLREKYVETYINSLTQLDKQVSARLVLRNYLKSNQSLNAISFASEQYLVLRDTAMAAYNLAKLYKLDNDNDLMWEYGKILVALGHHESGLDIMGNYVRENKENFDMQLSYAQMLEKASRNKDARMVLKPFSDMDTASYFIVDLYRKDQMWDSARFVLERVIAKDSSKRKPIWKLARLYEDRGWFLSSIPFLEYLVDLNSNDTLAQQRIDLIQRKIAYLQRLKFEESKIPTIELEPKKIEN